MNVIRIGGELQIEGQTPDEAVSKKEGIFVLSPTLLTVRTLERQVAFHAGQWFMGHEGFKGDHTFHAGQWYLGYTAFGPEAMPMPAAQALFHKDKYEMHTKQLQELRELAAQASAGAGVELLPYHGAGPVSLAEAA